MKENIKAPRHWPLCGEFTGTGEFPAQRASYAENVSIWWRHHVAVRRLFVWWINTRDHEDELGSVSWKGLDILNYKWRLQINGIKTTFHWRHDSIVVVSRVKSHCDYIRSMLNIGTLVCVKYSLRQNPDLDRHWSHIPLISTLIRYRCVGCNSISYWYRSDDF